jgi:hypothetical protein
VGISTFFYPMASNRTTKTPSYIYIFLVTIIVIGLFNISIVNAQEESTTPTIIHELNADNFPEITFLLEGYDQEGNAFNNLSKSDIEIIENEQGPIPIDLLQQIEPGYQVIVAYNLAPALANITQEGISRYQAITNHIIEWLDTRPANTPDDFSLATDTGLQAIRNQSPQEFAQTLRDYQPDLMNSQLNLTSLLQALDLATDPTLNPMTKRAILYITPQPLITNVSAFEGFIERAVEQKVPIYIWMVGPASARTSNPSVVDPLVGIAESTGGQFFLYSGQEDLPDIEDYFRDKRNIFKITYTSEIRNSGTQSIAAVIQQDEHQITSETATFNLTVQAPSAILIDPPLLIERIWDVDPVDASIRDLGPDQTEIQYMYVFPDGHAREISSARFYVDGEVQQEVTQAPFEKFILDLTPYESSQEVLFSIEIEDQLGLTSRTQPSLIEINVEPMPLTFWEGLMRLELTPERWIILATVLVAGTVLVIAFILVGKRQAFWREQAAIRKRYVDPVTQPVKINQDQGRSAKFGKASGTTAKKVEAMLIPLNDHYEPNRKKTVVLDRKEWVVGCDPKQARLVILQSALDDVHARITSTEQGDFWIRDLNSVVGTWVNFTPISSKGVKLRHGDIIQFAKSMYRFELSHPTDNRDFEIITYNQNNDS